MVEALYWINTHMTSNTHHMQQSLVVPEGSHHTYHRHSEHDETQQYEDHSRSQKHPLQGAILLPLHFCIHSDTEHAQTEQLKGQGQVW